jgi:hypothetical protein
MRLLQRAPDGGSKSGVSGYFLIEIKSLFSIVLLHFAPGSREAYHEHAFNAWTLWLGGHVIESVLDPVDPRRVFEARPWKAGDLKYTPRELMHKITAGDEGAWAISIRGPWVNTWREWSKGSLTTLTHGRKEVPSV